MSISTVARVMLSRTLNDSQKRVMKHYLFKLLYGQDLSKLAVAFGTDKAGGHYYTQHYQRHFQALRRQQLNILEIGIGGYDNPKAGGGSLRLWKAFFPNSRIFGIDIFDKKYHEESRIKTFKGSQVDEAFMRQVAADIGPLDIVIDDGSHMNAHIITTFKILFPLMSAHGIYVAEDLQYSYREKIGDERWDGSMDRTAAHTCMNYFKSLTDGLNYEEFPLDKYEPSDFDKHIVAMHFYHNLVFIQRGLNNEGSNIFGKRFS